MTRQIVLDTETTGIDPKKGHKIIEIGCVELIDRALTGETFHTYIKPNRKVDPGALKVHGISNDFLEDKPTFDAIVESFIEFVNGAELIIHNAPFDVGFINAELGHLKWKKSLEAHCSIVDTLTMARQKHPGQRNNLDALCKRYQVDNTKRQYHGALLDAEILASVYLAMTGGQTSLFSDEGLPSDTEKANAKTETLTSQSPVIKATKEELQAHDAFMALLEEES